jgi:hypothetical protein
MIDRHGFLGGVLALAGSSSIGIDLTTHGLAGGTRD